MRRNAQRVTRPVVRVALEISGEVSMKRKLEFEHAVLSHITEDSFVFEFVMTCEGHKIGRYFDVPFPGTDNQIKYRAEKAIKELRQTFAIYKQARKKLQKACILIRSNHSGKGS